MSRPAMSPGRSADSISTSSCSCRSQMARARMPFSRPSLRHPDPEHLARSPAQLPNVVVALPWCQPSVRSTLSFAAARVMATSTRPTLFVIIIYILTSPHDLTSIPYPHRYSVSHPHVVVAVSPICSLSVAAPRLVGVVASFCIASRSVFSSGNAPFVVASSYCTFSPVE